MLVTHVHDLDTYHAARHFSTKLSIGGRWHNVRIDEPPKNTERIVTLVADKINGIVRIGWCVKVSQDTWNRKHGIALAWAKAFVHNYPAGKMPKVVLKYLPKFLLRCSFYYKMNVNELIAGVVGLRDNKGTKSPTKAVVKEIENVQSDNH